MGRVGKIAMMAVLAMMVATPLRAVTPMTGIFTDYSSMDGMAHNNIHDIHIDSRGFVWLCTWSGVSRFDGYNFKNYCTDPKSMPVRHNRFRNVEEDSRGNLWFRTYDDHIYRFTPQEEAFEELCALIPQLHGKSHRAGRIICSRESNQVWIEYQGYGIVEFFSDEKNALHHKAHIGSPLIGGDIAQMCTDHKGQLWVALENGTLSMLAHNCNEPKEIASGLGKVVAMSISENQIVVASGQTLWQIDIKSEKISATTPFHHDTITSLAVSPNGDDIFIGTAQKGVYAMGEDGGLRHFTAGTMPSRVRDMVIDSHGTVWITCDKDGITRLDPTKGNYKHFSQKQNTVQFYAGENSVIIERDDVVWIKMSGVGFGYYDREKDSVEPFYNDPSKPDFKLSNGVAIFEVDQDNVLWLSTYYERGLHRVVLQRRENNLFRLESGATHQTSFLDEVRALSRDRRGRLWVGTKEGHLYCYSPTMELLHHISRLPSGRALGAIYTIKEDSHGNLWVGTKGDGVYRLTPKAESAGYSVREYRHSAENPYSLSNDMVYSIEEDGEGKIWIATYGGAINMLPSWDSERVVNTLNSFPLYPTESGERTRYLLLDDEHRMLLGSSEGLIWFDPTLAPEKMAFGIAQRGINTPHTLQANDVIHILKDARGDIWLSTYGGGLSRIESYDESGTPHFRTYSTSDGLPSNIVLAATQTDDGSLWLSTENGITRFDSAKEIFTSYTHYDGYEPVKYSETTAITDSSGRVVVGCADNRLQLFDPNHKADESYNYRLQISSFEVESGDTENQERHSHNYAAYRGEPVSVEHNYRLFRITFSALNFRLQEQVTYMYKLEGYDEDWNYTNDFNSVYYTKVPHGRYTFRVKAYAGTPHLASPEVTLPIHITTPPWASWWAWVLYIISALGLLWLITFLYLRFVRLRNSARMEQDMAEMKLKFFTNISHELRTPLTLIIGGIEDVKRRESLSEKGEDSLTLSHKNAKRMLTLINQLLDFRKVVKNKMDLRVERLNIVRLAKEVTDNFRESADEKHIELIFSFSLEDIYIWCDPERIESLLYNLLSNAIKFTKNRGRVVVTVSKREDEECVRISVSDTGIGIPKERQESIFDRFTTYASAVRGEVSGSGIGLALCKEIVELHHGEIEVESKVGVGTTFTVSLKTGNSHFTMEQIVFGDTTPAQADTSKRTDITPPEGAYKIVLAEDNSQMRNFLFNQLAENYEVIEATDGQEALEKIHASHPDIVITDLMMPRMDGIELVERIRKDFEISHLPVIMLTAKQTPEDRIMAMKYGADGYITKPFSMELLLARIDNLLTQRKLIFEKMSSSVAGHIVPEISPKDVVVTNRDEEFLKRLMEWLEENIENSELTIDLLAGHLRLGRTTMYNKIKSLTGKSPVELIKEYRLTKSEMLLRTGQFSVSEVAYKVGFSDPGYFSRCFKEQYKSSPVEYLRSRGLKSN